jgi:hypothetical protein
MWEEEGAWTLTPEFTLGQLDAPEEEVFAALIGLKVDGGGRIYVLDRDINQLRIFSADGSFLQSAGGPGEGPGEYRNANGLEWLTPDSLVVVDQRGNRYSILSKEGDFARSVPRNLGFYSWVFRGGVTDGRIYEVSSVRDGDESLPALMGTALGDSEPGPTSGDLPSGESPSGEAPAGAGPGSGRGLSLAVDTILLPISDAPPYESFSIRTDRGGMVMGIPFAPSYVYHLDPSGRLWHGYGGEFRIFQSTLQGDTLREIVLEGDPVPVSSQELAEFEGGEAARRFRELGGDLDLGRIPEVKPFFEGIYEDPDGYLWVSTPSEPQTVAFAVIDPEGRYLGRLEVEGFERETYIDPVVRDGRLHLVGRDELGVQHVHVFRIDR